MLNKTITFESVEGKVTLSGRDEAVRAMLVNSLRAIVTFQLENVVKREDYREYRDYKEEKKRYENALAILNREAYSYSVSEIIDFVDVLQFDLEIKEID